MVNTPVLFMVFNRPEKTQKVFDVIRLARPKKLYLAADGPRKGNNSDVVNCEEVKRIVSLVDWECTVKKLFHAENLGCSRAGIAAWNWFFSQEEEMIFLEDDGLVSLSFFQYCDVLLDKYRNDKRIAYIVGTNHGVSYGSNTYFFSRFGGDTYAMATWKRVHELYEYDLHSFIQVKNRKEFRGTFVNGLHYHSSMIKYMNYINHGGNTYDLQITYLVHKNNMFNVVPNVNMCTNIGFDFDASNTIVDPEGEIAKKYGNRTRFELESILHPTDFFVDRQFEREYCKCRVFGGKSWIEAYYRFYVQIIVLPMIRRKIKSILRAFGFRR